MDSLSPSKQAGGYVVVDSKTPKGNIVDATTMIEQCGVKARRVRTINNNEATTIIGFEK